MARKTRLMREVEDKYQRPLERPSSREGQRVGSVGDCIGIGSEQGYPGVLDPQTRYQCPAGGARSWRDAGGQAGQLMHGV